VKSWVHARLRGGLRPGSLPNEPSPPLPESPEFAALPPMLATGYLVGVLRWTSMRGSKAMLAPSLTWPLWRPLITRTSCSSSANMIRAV